MTPGRRLIVKIARAEAPEADDLVDDQAGRHVSARDDEYSRLPIRGGAPAPKNDFRSTTVSSWPRRFAMPRSHGLAPGTRVTWSGTGRTSRTSRAARHESLSTEPKSNAHPFVRLRRSPFARRDRSSRAALELEQQVERSIGEGEQAQADSPSFEQFLCLGDQHRFGHGLDEIVHGA